jgi:asparagine synthase (glutamine-hydrolysing)
MCGIAGIAGLHEEFVPDMSALRRMCDSIVHRGPDDEGFACTDNVALGMRRLSIIDVEGGAQPIYNEDRSICVTLNGEIYNYRELREDLQRAGHRFATQSDTEVLVHAYEEYGIDFLGRLNGMFALALHDARRRQVVLARDQMGIKPLFYSVCNEAIVWGSEVKAILASGLIERTLNSSALLDFLAWEYVPGDASLFKEVAKLQAGHYLVVRQGAPVEGPKKYWDIPTSVSNNDYSEEELLDRLDSAIRESVRRQMVSDVPLGAFLSGGVDSSLVVSAMGAAKTFSIGFDDPSYNELPFSEEVARHLGTEHSTQVIKPHVADLFDHLMVYMDDPIGDFSIFPTYLVSRLARESVTVSLSGDGGDELFGGYETYSAQRIATKYARLPDWMRRVVAGTVGQLPITKKKKGLLNKAKRFVEGCEYPDELEHARWRLFLPEMLRRSLFTPDFAADLEYSTAAHIEKLFSRAGHLGPLSRCLYVDARSYLVDNCLVKVDRMSMATSLEVRVPFLDTSIVELAFSMPDNLKLRGHQTKYLLKKLAARYIPDHCVYRPKEGFSIPIKNWLAGQVRDILEAYTSDIFIKSQGIFNEKVVSRLKSEHLAGSANHSHTLWSLIVFNAWYQRWLSHG